MARILEAKFTWPRDVEVNRDLKNMVNNMLRKETWDRFGSIVIPPVPGELAVNDELRGHPFMAKFPWKHMLHRKLAVSIFFPDLLSLTY